MSDKQQWQTYRFEQIAANINERVDNPSEAGVDRYVGLEHLDPDSLKIRRWGSPSDVEATKLRFYPGDIVFGRRRAYQRKLGVADFEGICSAHAMVLRAKPAVVMPEFLPFFMQSDLFMKRALEISVGSLSPTINWKTLAAQEFALPPLDEQRRIAELLIRLVDTRNATTTLIEALEQLQKSFIFNAFNRLARSNEVEIITVEEAGEVVMGRQRSPQYDQGFSPRPYLRVANVYDGYIDTSDVKQMDFSDSEQEQFLLKPGDVLLVEGHSSADVVGRSAIYNNEVPGACFQNTLLRFRPYTCSPEYAHQYFRYCLMTKQFAQTAKQTTIAHLGATRFAQMRFLLPSGTWQQHIVETLLSIEQNLEVAKKRANEVNQLRARAMATEMLAA